MEVRGPRPQWYNGFTTKKGQTKGKNSAALSNIQDTHWGDGRTILEGLRNYDVICESSAPCDERVLF